MNIQGELQKIHQQYGTTEMANYEIQKLFDKQQERSYSEEEVLDIITKWEQQSSWKEFPEEWLEQFKKKKI